MTVLIPNRSSQRSESAVVEWFYPVCGPRFEAVPREERSFPRVRSENRLVEDEERSGESQGVSEVEFLSDGIHIVVFVLLFRYYTVQEAVAVESTGGKL